MQIRLAQMSDLPAAAQLWFDRITLLQQTDRRIKLLPDARENWSAAAARWTGDERTRFWVAEDGGALVGFTVVRLASGAPGLQPQRRGLLLEMVVDLHETHRGLADQLLDHARRWLAAMGAGEIEVDVPARYPVETAFWRAQGGAAWSERFRLPL
ncbi:MAG: GNAT family N-acetyltransferase [Chloroflexi bacterium]|nr:GNAT family N-acetyltransferase [Chloroflexota bacterium]